MTVREIVRGAPEAGGAQSAGWKKKKEREMNME
jgi:hypothetical protein